MDNQMNTPSNRGNQSQSVSIGLNQSQGPELRMSSREIAELCDKQHKHILRDVKLMLEQIGLPEEGYAQIWTNPQNGQKYPEYRLPKDLTTTLITGYRIDLRYKVIKRLEELEARTPALPDFNDPIAAAQAWIDAQMQTKSANERVVQLMPKVEALDRLDALEGSLSIRLAAKQLDVPERWFAKWLQLHSWAFRQNGVGTLQAYAAKRQQGYMEHKPTQYRDSRGEDRIGSQLMITAKGLTRLAYLLRKEPRSVA